MIQVHFRPAGGAAIDVEVADGKEAAVLQRAAERVFPGPVDPKLEAESEMRWRAVMAERARRAATTKKESKRT